MNNNPVRDTGPAPVINQPVELVNTNATAIDLATILLGVDRLILAYRRQRYMPDVDNLDLIDVSTLHNEIHETVLRLGAKNGNGYGELLELRNGMRDAQ